MARRDWRLTTWAVAAATIAAFGAVRLTSAVGSAVAARTGWIEPAAAAALGLPPASPAPSSPSPSAADPSKASPSTGTSTAGPPPPSPSPTPAALVPAASVSPAPAAVGLVARPAPPAADPDVLTIRYGPAAHQLLDLHLPPEHGGRPVPVIVYLHAGGWVSGSRADVPDVALAQLARGYAVASVDYRLASTSPTGEQVVAFPDALWDVKRAIRYLKVHASTWGLDAGSVDLMGTSAGGHLATLAAASAGQLEPPVEGVLGAVDSSVQAVVGISAVTDLTTFAAARHPWAPSLTAALLGCPTEPSPRCPVDAMAAASVAPYVDASDPPLYLALGGKDDLVRPATQGRPLADRWAKAHGGERGSVAYHVAADGDHNLTSDQVDRASLAAFLDRARDAADLERQVVVLYGDSLAWEAQDAFRAELERAGVRRVVTRTYGGTAICDWLDEMTQDQAALRPTAVVVEFSGNAFTPCMHGTDGRPLAGDDAMRKYVGDARQVLQTFAPQGVPVYFVSAPVTQRESEAPPARRRLADVYAGLTLVDPDARFVDAAASVTNGGRWTRALACLPGEPCTGGRAADGGPVNVVRAPDGTHFCPAGSTVRDGVPSPCPVWSSGAYRYGIAMAASVLRYLGVGEGV